MRAAHSGRAIIVEGVDISIIIRHGRGVVGADSREASNATSIAFGSAPRRRPRVGGERLLQPFVEKCSAEMVGLL